jgi:hypothetical protein
LLKLFGPASMTYTSGAREDPSCRYHDDRVSPARKLEWLAEELRGDMPAARMAFERFEKFLAGLSGEERGSVEFALARASLATDGNAREAYLSLARATADPALRVRMAGVALDIGWLDAASHRAELARTIHDVVAANAVDFGEVDLICALNKDDALANELTTFKVATVLPAHSAGAAAGACAGDAKSRETTLRALASADERDVRMAQAFLRHRPHHGRRRAAPGGHRHQRHEGLGRAGARAGNPGAPAHRGCRGAATAGDAVFAGPLRGGATRRRGSVPAIRPFRHRRARARPALQRDRVRPDPPHRGGPRSSAVGPNRPAIRGNAGSAVDAMRRQFRMRFAFVPAALAVAFLAVPAAAEKKTVCTITVNSSDEKDAMRARLPKGEYEFVELVEKGRPDWLRGACERKIQCDALVISGHFNAGEDFYSDKIETREHLRMDELERASCSGSCPGLFSRLKEVYLFGCESLNPIPPSTRRPTARAAATECAACSPACPPSTASRDPRRWARPPRRC